MASEKMGELTCVDFWANGYGMRVRIALQEMQIGFSYIEEDFRNQETSKLVLDMNPVYQFTPILLHHGRPICLSKNILEYIDEVWGGQAGRASLLPSDPLKRAHQRFWGDYVDQKIFDTQTRFLKSKGDDKVAIKKELINHFKRLEDVLGDSTFFGGDEFGFLDVVIIPYSSMFHGYEQHGGFDFKEECPKLMCWVERCRGRDSVQTVLPDDEEMYDLHKKWYGIE
ncbi:unnamed protein product [Urochloa decumbens]|uniref:Glutathione S-transferase n=1 Tax=Urochloa decumbens TaxID=240449 RepID=A0ABC8YC69_9POAL